ncbi:MAG: hypothetical protein QXY35_09185 [Thermofilaceae archaeon]
MRLLTPRVFEALKTALTVEVLVGDGGLAGGAPPTRESGGLEVLRLLEARPLAVNFQVGEGEVRVGCGDGVMSDFEIEALGEYGRVVSGMREEVPVGEVERLRVKGLRFVEEERVGDLPRGVLPVSGVVDLLYLPRDDTVILPYRFNRVRLGERRELRFVLPKSFLRERARAVHPVYGRVYEGEVVGVEVDVRELVRGGYPQLAVVSSRRRFGGRLSILRVLGDEDLRELLSSLGV